MLRDAELFVMAENMLVEVLGRIRPEHHTIVVPPLAGVIGTDPAATLPDLVRAHLADDAQVPARLADRPDPAMGSSDPVTPLAEDSPIASALHDAVVRVAAAACTAARKVSDGGRRRPGPDGPVAATQYLRRLRVVRCLTAHYVAAYLGSTACPLPEELARPLWELTAAGGPGVDIGAVRTSR